MTIIIKDIPGLTTREVLDALMDITSSVSTGFGGFVVDEEAAEEFLLAYLIASGQRPISIDVPAVIGLPADPTGDVEPIELTGPAPARTTARRAGRRKGA